MGKRAFYSESVKAAVMGALLEGQAVSKIAEDYDIPESTIRNWKSASDFKDAIGQEKKEEIGDLLLDYLRTSLQALKAQAEHFADKTWLADQDADQLAVLHGVQTDKAIRLLEALTRAEDEE